MELKQTIQCTTRVCASLEENGSVSIKVFGSAPYAPGGDDAPGPTTTAEVGAADIPEALRATLASALAAVLADEQVQQVLGNRIGQAIHKSAEVAAAHGEI